MRCNVCIEDNGVETAVVTSAALVNEVTGVNFVAIVCARCLSLGRNTRVTCNTFSAEDAQSRTNVL